VQGLEVGADDFLTKPVDDIALFARLKSLVRLKMLTDELRLRHETGRSMGVMDDGELDLNVDDEETHILVVEDRPVYADKINSTLSPQFEVTIIDNADDALSKVQGQEFDLLIVSLALKCCDGLRLCSHFRSLEETRQLPVIVLVEDDDRERLVRGLEMGVNDYVIRPIERNELLARVRTQIRHKRYADKLRRDLETGLELAVMDQLTGLYNRRYLSSHLDNLIKQAREGGKPLSLLELDIDHFKSINDTFGHDAGDQVLREFGRRVGANVRGIDLACRIGGEEFVVVMPETDVEYAYTVAERLRQAIGEVPFDLNGEKPLKVTVSIGITEVQSETETAQTLMQRADQALYTAKRDGRDRVVAKAA
jgi:two-component system cell cycle response regulator